MAEKPQETSAEVMTRFLQRQRVEKPTRYHAIPRFVVNCPKLQPRSFPYNLPVGPLRPTSPISRPPALGLGKIRGMEEKNVNKEGIILPPIQYKVKGKEREYGRNAMATEYGSSIEHEKNADLVRYRAVRQEPEPGIWQEVACEWDQSQTRPNQFHEYESDQLIASTPPTSSRLQDIYKSDPIRNERTAIVMPKMETKEESKQIRFTRPTPGYGGYVSRYPVEPRGPQGTWDEVFVNFSKLTYRSYPSKEYVRKEFAHRGPLSRLVTTTYPSNPFTKVDKWNSRPKMLWKRATHSKFI